MRYVMAERDTDGILDMISALQRMEIGDLDRLVRIRNRILDNDVRQDDIDYVYDAFGQIHDRPNVSRIATTTITNGRSSRAWYLLPIFLSVVGGIIAYLGLRHVDPQRARKTLLVGISTFAVFVLVLAAGIATTDDSPSSDEELNIVGSTADTEYENVVPKDNEFVPEPEDVMITGAPSVNIAEKDTMQEKDMPAAESASVTEPREYEVHAIAYDDVPDYADPSIAVSALEQAIQAWELSNAFLTFEKVESDADLQITWRQWMPGGGLGLHTVFNSADRGSSNVIAIRLGNDDCHSDYQLYSGESLKHTIAHEIGHYLNLRHIDEKGHLMYSGELFDVDTGATYDDQGYAIPDIAEPQFKTQRGSILLQQLEAVEGEIREISSEREKIKSENSDDRDALRFNTIRYNEAAQVLDSLKDEIDCAELS